MGIASPGRAGWRAADGVVRDVRGTTAVGTDRGDGHPRGPGARSETQVDRAGESGDRVKRLAVVDDLVTTNPGWPEAARR